MDFSFYGHVCLCIILTNVVHYHNSEKSMTYKHVYVSMSTEHNFHSGEIMVNGVRYLGGGRGGEMVDLQCM